MPAEEITTSAVIETPAPVVAVASPAPQGAQVQMSSDQLKKRLDETRAAERRAVLTELGITDVPAAKAALAAPPKDDPERIAALEQKTASQEAIIAALKTANDTATAERAVAELASLSEVARKAIEDTTTKPEERIALAKLVRAASPPAPAAVAVPAPVATAPVVVATGPARTAPADGGSSPPDRKAEYERLKGTNPMAAAHYLTRHAREIFPG